jgi:hypothetical protein
LQKNKKFQGENFELIKENILKMQEEIGKNKDPLEMLR